MCDNEDPILISIIAVYLEKLANDVLKNSVDWRTYSLMDYLKDHAKNIKEPILYEKTIFLPKLGFLCHETHELSSME
jgi:hypothetical protein